MKDRGQLLVAEGDRRGRRSGRYTVSIKKSGQIILSRASASFFERGGVKAVVLYWDEETRMLSIKAVHPHPQARPLYYRTKGQPGRFSAKEELDDIGYDFGENRTFSANPSPDDGALEVILPRKAFLSELPPILMVANQITRLGS